MSLTISIKDTTNVGKVTHSVDVSFKHAHVTVREIIEARVMQEVHAFNEKRPDYFMGLVQPTDAEKTLNGYKMRAHKKIDPEKQVYIALDAFMKNGYFVLIDDKQAETLDQQIKIMPSTDISFIKLTPLVGG